jgi:hypothetical protein
MGCAPRRRRELADTTESRFWGVLLTQSACRSLTFQAEAFLGFCAQRASDSPRRTRARCGPKRRNADRCRHTRRQGGTGALCAPTALRPGSAPSRCHWMRPRQAPLAARRATPARRAHQSFDSPQGVISLGVHRSPGPVSACANTLPRDTGLSRNPHETTDRTADSQPHRFPADTSLGVPDSADVARLAGIPEVRVESWYGDRLKGRWVGGWTRPLTISSQCLRTCADLRSCRYAAARADIACWPLLLACDRDSGR